MVTRAKPVSWPGVRWAAVDDARLLVGVMEHGIGNWDSIRDDPDLNMGRKVAAIPIIIPTLQTLNTHTLTDSFG